MIISLLLSYIISFNVEINFARWLCFLVGYGRRNRGSERVRNVSEIEWQSQNSDLGLLVQDQCLLLTACRKTMMRVDLLLSGHLLFPWFT